MPATLAENEAWTAGSATLSICPSSVDTRAARPTPARTPADGDAAGSEDRSRAAADCVAPSMLETLDQEEGGEKRDLDRDVPCDLLARLPPVPDPGFPGEKG